MDEMPGATPGARAARLDDQLDHLDRTATPPARPVAAHEHPEMYGAAAQARQDARMERFGVEPVR